MIKAISNAQIVIPDGQTSMQTQAKMKVTTVM